MSVLVDATLVQLEQLRPDDAAERQRLAASVQALAAADALPAPVRDLIARAAAALADTTVSCDRAVTDARGLLRAARTRLALLQELAASTPQPVVAPPHPPDASRGGAQPLLPPEFDASLLRDFVAESRELAEGAEAALLSLEDNPDDTEAINTVFRAFHTVKGTSAFLGLTLITDLTHHAEALLSRMRDRELRCEGMYAALALRAADMLRVLMGRVGDELGGRPPAMLDDAIELTAELERYSVADAGEALEASALPPGVPVPPLELPAGQAPGVATAASTSGAVDSMRVRTAYVDRLMELVGELAIVQSIVAQDDTVTRAGDAVLGGKLRHAEKIARELQRLSMSMRLVPLKGLFQKVNRVTRDVAARTGKTVEFQSVGADTEIDRSMVDALNDPLVHMVRNAVDHGLESREQRLAAGKPEQGMVTLTAAHVGGNVVIELTDDGRGLDRRRIAEKAVERGLIASAEGLPDEEVFRLIFAPGFSTADAVTSVSGRGVGMDVVRHNIEMLRGRIEIASEPGKGTRFTIRVPLTLAISDGMLLRVGGERFIVPTLAIQLSFRPTRAALTTVVGNGEAVLLREELLPLVRLHRIFSVANAAEDPAQAVVMVVGDGLQRAALLVDELLGQQQVVVKSLGSGIAHAPGIAGGAILGDGRVGLILDVGGLLTLARRGTVLPPATLADATRAGRAVA